MIRLRGIRKVYKTGKVEFEALRGVDLDIEKGQSVAIIGPSGSGKSTLMHIIGLLDHPTTGTFHLDGDDTSVLRPNQLARLRNRRIGFVFQAYHLLKGAHAWENVALPLVYARVPRTKRREQALEALEKVGLAPWANHRSNELSGGQMQRVALARAIVHKPNLLLADEPTGNLDSKTTVEVLALFDRLCEEGLTLCMVTHDDSVADHAHRTVRILDGQIA